MKICIPSFIVDLYFLLLNQRCGAWKFTSLPGFSDCAAGYSVILYSTNISHLRCF